MLGDVKNVNTFTVATDAIRSIAREVTDQEESDSFPQAEAVVCSQDQTGNLHPSI